MRVTGPAAASVGVPVTYDLRIANAGQLTAQNAIVRTEFDDGLDGSNTSRSNELSVGTLAPGQVRNLQITATPRKNGQLRSVFTVLADGFSPAAQEIKLDARAVRLNLELVGTERIMVGQSNTWSVRIVNTGDAPAANTLIRLQLPQGLRADTADDGGKLNAGVAVWSLGSLAPGAKREVHLTATPTMPIARTSIVATAVAERTPEVRLDRGVEAMGTALLKFNLVASGQDVEVGNTIVYSATLRNAGSLPLDNVEVFADLPANLSPRFGNGPTVSRIDGQRVTFGKLARLEPGRIVEYRFEVEGKSPGNARIQVSASSTSLAEAVQQEEATQVLTHP